ncbi:MAG TPA: hypothetical protein VFP84_06180 [Kofleriaceae bacterium]|nr:hypothetical protein [Kofleriaceae bacterium]
MKKLKLQRETVRVLDHMTMGHVVGGVMIGTPQTTKCRIGTGGACSGGSCVETVTSGGTSVILPPETIALPSGG